MKQAIHSGSASQGREKFILLLIGLIGAAGLIFVLNSNSSKSAFSENVVGQERIEMSVGN